MASNKHIVLIATIITILTLLLTVLFMNGKNLGLVDNTANQVETNDGKWSVDKAHKIDLSNLDSLTQDTGAVLKDNSLMILTGGDYLVTGDLSDGQILIDTSNEESVHLFLDNMSVDAGDKAALQVEKAQSVVLTSKEGSTNSFNSNLKEDDTSKVDGTIYCRSDLTVNGAGTVEINSDNTHALVCNDNLNLLGGTLKAKAAVDSIHVNDSVVLDGSILNLESGDDAITIKNDEDSGTFTMESGEINISRCAEGIEASQIKINDGKVDINMTDDGINATGGDNPLIEVNGGNIRVVCERGNDSDGLDSNGNITLNGGEIFINIGGNGLNNAIDVATETGGSCSINGATVQAFCGESMEMALNSDSQGIISTNQRGSNDMTVDLKSTDEKILLNSTVPYSFTNVLLTSPDIEANKEYILSLNGSTSTVRAESEVSGGMPNGKNMGGNFRNNQGNRSDLSSGTTESTQPSQAFSNSQGTTPPEPPDGFSGDSQSSTPPEGFSGDNQFREPPEGFSGDSQFAEPPEGFSSDGQFPQPPEMMDGSDNSNSSQPPELPNSENQSDSDGLMFEGNNTNPRSKQPMNNPMRDQETVEPAVSPLNLVIVAGCFILLLVGILFSLLAKGRFF